MWLAYANLNFARADKHDEDFIRIQDEQPCAVVGLVELRRRLRFPGYSTHQPDRPDRSVGSEGIFIATGTTVERTTGQLSVTDRLGFAIGWRRTLIAVVEVPGVGMVAYVLIHMPPLRMRGALYKAYAYRLHRLLRRLNAQGVPWVVFGDMNWLVSNDPAELEATFGARWYGKRIDGVAVHPDLVPFVRGHRTHQPKGRDDQHPFVFMRLAKP